MLVGSKYLKYRYGDVFEVHKHAIYNGKDTNPPLSTVNTVGFNLYGDFRMDINGSMVKYNFFCIFFPLFPIGCYRAKLISTNYLGRKGAAQVTQVKYEIYGTEKWDFVEVMLIYLFTISIVLVILILYFLCRYLA